MRRLMRGLEAVLIAMPMVAVSLAVSVISSAPAAPSVPDRAACPRKEW